MWASPKQAAASIFLTRPAGRNDHLRDLLHQENLQVFEAPALSIEFLDTPRAPLDSGALYVFVSRQAVDAFFSTQQQTVWPQDAWAGAVGAATARALMAHVPADRVLAPVPGSAPDSESLLAAIDRFGLIPSQVHILRAEQGRDWLAERLRKRGWPVLCHALYRRSPLLWDRSVCLQLVQPSNNILLVTSLQSLEAIAASLLHYGLAWPAHLHAVTLHARIARRLQCLYADQSEDALSITLSAPDDTALFQAILAASRLPHRRTRTPS